MGVGASVGGVAPMRSCQLVAFDDIGDDVFLRQAQNA